MESQRDSINQPRVARNELPWDTAPQVFNPERVVSAVEFAPVAREWHEKMMQPFQG